jgi:hypothetical protein
MVPLPVRHWGEGAGWAGGSCRAVREVRVGGVETMEPSWPLAGLNCGSRVEEQAEEVERQQNVAYRPASTA